MLLTCLLLGSVLFGIYIRNINYRTRVSVQNQTDHAVADLDTQLNAMRMLSLKLSVQRVFDSDYVFENKTHEIEMLDALSQYHAYADLPAEFALMYRNGAKISVFRSEGVKTDLDVFVRRYGLETSEELTSFLFDSEQKARVFYGADVMLIAYPVRANSIRAGRGTLCFVVDAKDLEERIALSSDLPAGNYALFYQGHSLVQGASGGVSSGDDTGFRIEAGVHRFTLADMMVYQRDTLFFLLGLGALFGLIVALAYVCYSPIRSVAYKYADAQPDQRNNELVLLDRTMAQMQQRSRALDSQVSSSAALLRNYALLMLLSNANASGVVPEMERIGLRFPHRLFCVAAAMPEGEQAMFVENMDAAVDSLEDMDEDVGSLYAVECSRKNHTLAVLCNAEQAEQLEMLLQRLRAYLNCQPIRFTVGVGQTVESLTGVPSSYLTALDNMQRDAEQSAARRQQPSGNISDTAVSLRRLAERIDCADCQGALLELENYMNLMTQTASELMRRYNLFNLNCAIQRQCEKHAFELSGEQMTMLLTSANENATHYGLLRLIPALCAHVQQAGRQAVQPASRLVIEYLKRNFCEYSVSAQGAAEAVGLGINRTNAIIREETGMSCKAYLTYLRVEHAKKLLRETAAPVSEICTQVGYASASHFIKVFKTTTGQTPDAYRRAFLEEDEKQA